MNKRIVCVLLTLIMLMSLVPVSASAAGMGISESAITVLKQLEGYTTICDTNGYTGYGTLCTEKGAHGGHRTTEKQADTALRAKLSELDEAVSRFASNKGLSLSQSKHDALVLFSFENGTAWTTGTGDLQAAVASGKSGSDFLNAICRWDESNADDSRRMIEANMYLYGIYSSGRPSNFIRVYYVTNDMAYQLPDGAWETFYGSIQGNTIEQYYDVTVKTAPHLNPTMDNHTFTGWYHYTEYGWEKVSSLTASNHEDVLVAGWVPDFSVPGDTSVSYVVKKSQLLSQRTYWHNPATGNFGAVVDETVEDYFFMDDALWVESDYLAEDGTRWCKIRGEDRWVKVRLDGQGVDVDVNVTVTNSYLRRRASASIYSAQNGSYNQGAVLRIIDTEKKDGFLWGEVATSATDNTPLGWVALMYTNYESVINSSSASANNSNAIAKAVITYNGYVNVRSDAGTHNRIVSALPKGTEVSLFETKFVNGLEWGRCSTGWFCLSYANVTRLTNTSANKDEGFTAYAFAGTVDPHTVAIYQAPSTSANRIFTRQYINPAVTVTNLVYAEGMTWGKIAEGWIMVSDNLGNARDVDLATAKFVVTSNNLTVRSDAYTAADRVDSLGKGVEFNVNYQNQVIVVGDTVWAYATKVGETGTNSYYGWVNLETKNVSRVDAPALDDNTNENHGQAVTGLMGTVINTNALKVRQSDATYAAILGTLSNGTTVAIWESNDDETWYKVDSNQNGVYDYEEDGWVFGSYLNVFEGTTDGTASNGSASGKVETGMGVVANTYSGLNVRTGAGTGYGFVCKLLPGTSVEILEVKTVGATKWGRTAQGWVSMDYIAMVSNYPINGTTGGSMGGNSGTTTGSEVAIYTGTALVDLTVYKETSTKAEAVRTLMAGDPITLHEIRTVVTEETSDPVTNGSSSSTTTTKTTSYWARVNDGYIYDPQNVLALDTVNEDIYTVTGAETLNVRNAAGTQGTSIVFKLAKGSQVAVTRLTIINGNVWGFIEANAEKTYITDEDGNKTTEYDWNGEGWISLAYTTKGAVIVQDNNQNNNTNNNTNNNVTTPPAGMGNGSSVGGAVNNTTGYRYTGTVIRSNELNVRATPSTAATKTTTLSKGAALVIYETTTVDGMAWGRCDAGWVYLYYVDLVPVTGAVDARVISADNTIIYSDMNGTSVAGTYAKQAVVDIYEIVGKMARTELGWVSTDNLL